MWWSLSGLLLPFCFLCRQPPFGATAIYVNIGLLFVCGVATGFNHFRHAAAVLHALHLICMSVVIYTTDALHYRSAVKVYTFSA